MESRLGDFSTTPLYNIKAVVQVTEISSSTLRAWERRYNVGVPQRSASGYRLYSDRDIAIIRWLKRQVDTGMSISQAVSWYRKLVEETDSLQDVVLPEKTHGTLQQGAVDSGGVDVPTVRSSVRNFSILQEELLNSLLHYRENQAEQVLTEAFSLYALEEVCDNLIAPVLVEVGERWHSGELSITREHYATGYLRHRIVSLLRTVAAGTPGPLVWIGCAPGELHEIGSLMLSVYLCRAGYQVRYLGQDLPLDDLIEEVKLTQPAILLLSAATKESSQNLKRLTEQLSSLTASGLLIGYGGRVFNRNPELRTEIPGIYLGATAHEAVETVNELLRK